MGRQLLLHLLTCGLMSCLHTVSLRFLLGATEGCVTGGKSISSNMRRFVLRLSVFITVADCFSQYHSGFKYRRDAYLQYVLHTDGDRRTYWMVGLSFFSPSSEQLFPIPTSSTFACE